MDTIGSQTQQAATLTNRHVAYQNGFTRFWALLTAQSLKSTIKKSHVALVELTKNGTAAVQNTLNHLQRTIFLLSDDLPTNNEMQSLHLNVTQTLQILRSVELRQLSNQSRWTARKSLSSRTLEIQESDAEEDDNQPKPIHKSDKFQDEPSDAEEDNDDDRPTLIHEPHKSSGESTDEGELEEQFRDNNNHPHQQSKTQLSETHEDARDSHDEGIQRRPSGNDEYEDEFSPGGEDEDAGPNSDDENVSASGSVELGNPRRDQLRNEAATEEQEGEEQNVSQNAAHHTEMGQVDDLSATSTPQDGQEEAGPSSSRKRPSSSSNPSPKRQRTGGPRAWTEVGIGYGVNPKSRKSVDPKLTNSEFLPESVKALITEADMLSDASDEKTHHRKINKGTNKGSLNMNNPVPTLCWLSENHPLDGFPKLPPGPSSECAMCIARIANCEDGVCFCFKTATVIMVLTSSGSDIAPD
jgi:hypothetical protein